MDIRFADESLARCFREESCAVRRWGAEVANRYAFVIAFLTCVDAVGDLGKFAFLDAVGLDSSLNSPGTVRLADGWRLALEAVEGSTALVVKEVEHDD